MAILEKWVTSALAGTRKRALLEKNICQMLSLGYRFGIKIRNKLYDQSIFSIRKLPKMCVVSVGNIAACGMGKTPLVQKLVQELSCKIPVAILSRGFRSEIERQKKNRQVELSYPGAAALFGDEPTLLAKKGGVPVFVGIDRYTSGIEAASQGIRCAVLDDGLQHRKLARDLEIIVVDAKDPFASHKFLPTGWLRDEINSLKRATHIVAVSIETNEEYKEVCGKLASITSAPVIGMRPHAALPLLPSTRVGLFCGIGRPERFLKTARDLKLEIVDTLISSDHKLPEEKELEAFAKKCKERGADSLVCTEKDRVKLPLNLCLPLPVISIGMELQVTVGKEHWDQLIHTIVKKSL